jgi:hypothetical protein
MLLIYGSLFLNGVYYCLSVLVCCREKVGMNIKFLVELGKSGNKIREMLVQVYGEGNMLV